MPIFKLLSIVAVSFSFLYAGAVHTVSAWDITHLWDTGDINSRVTAAVAIIDKDHDGTPHIIAPIQHGVRCYDEDGNLQWSYSGISNGYDVRDLVVGDLNGTGYNDSVVVASGYYSTASHGKFAVLDKDGNVLQYFTGNDFAAPPSSVSSIELDGTDIYVGTNLGITKFVKSGSTWSEDSVNWAKGIGGVSKIGISDMGNGKRVYVANSSGANIYSYETNGTQEWVRKTNNYQTLFAIGKTDSSKDGLQMIVPTQSNLYVLDKDGNISWNSGSPGSNVRSSVVLHDNDNDGEDEIYYTDMARDVYAIERTGNNTYGLQYSLLDAIGASQYAGLAKFDINEDGEDEIFIYTTNGYLLIYDKTLSTQLKSINLGHGQAGGLYSGYQFRGNGILFEDVSGDGHADVVIAGSTGYVDVYETSGFGSLPIVTTQAVSDIGISTATANGEITDTGGEDNDKVGFVYGTTSESLPGNIEPATSGYLYYSEDTGSFSAGTFSVNLTSNLIGGTTYYGRVYSHNSNGYSYGNEVSFTTAVISISITSDGSVSYGLVPLDTTKDTTASDLNDTQTTKNTGTLVQDLNIKSSDATSGIEWVISNTTNGPDQFMHEFSINSGTSWTPMSTNYMQLISNMSPDETQDFDLRLTTPTISSDLLQKSITITIQAVAH